jgi:hypothetical protein
MALVAWILAIAGAGLALVMGMSKGMSHRRNLELATVLAIMPLPVLAIWFAGPEVYRAAQEGTPVRELVFPGGPVVIAAGTLLGIVRAYLGQEKRRL